MKASAAIFALLVASAAGEMTNPIAKVVEMVSGLQQKVLKESEQAQKAYNEFAEMCEDRSQQLHFEIKTGKATVQEKTSVIEKASADITVLTEKVGGFASSISSAESDLKKATAIRKTENSAFKAAQKELLTTISAIQRAAAIIEREMKKGASFAQTNNMQSVIQTFTAMVDAEAIDSDDGASLMALMQSSSNSDEDSDEMGAPSAASYTRQSGGIQEALENLLAKAEAQLESLRKTETGAANAYAMQKQSLEDKIKFANKEMAEAKKDLAETNEKKATASGELGVSKKELAEDVKSLGALHHQCLTEATNYEEATKDRGEELKALATAKKIIQESTGGATKQKYGLAQTESFLQVSAKAQDGEAFRAVSMVRHLAMSLRSNALVNLATRMADASHSSADPFKKVKNLIRGMIEKLLNQADAEATKKAYCDKEMAETKFKVEDKTDAIKKLSVKIDVMSAESKKLKGEVATLQKELGALARTQAEMDKLRIKEKATYQKNKPEMKAGIKGVKAALKVLRDYYAQNDKTAQSGAGGGIIGMLEVVESDFSKGLAECIAGEEASAAEYEKATNENKLTKAAKEQDVKYKTKDHVGLDKSITELKADRSGVNAELSAVNQYFAGIKKQCVAKPEPYEEKVKRRNAEIAGLKDALETLSGNAVFLQRSAVHKHLRAHA